MTCHPFQSPPLLYSPSLLIYIFHILLQGLEFRVFLTSIFALSPNQPYLTWVPHQVSLSRLTSPDCATNNVSASTRILPIYHATHILLLCFFQHFPPSRFRPTIYFGPGSTSCTSCKRFLPT